MGKTSIQWTDASWNPVTGCKELSPGCANCYAAKLAATRLAETPRYKGLAVLGDNGHPHWTGDARLHPDKLTEPLGWKKPRKIFVCDMADLFYDGVPDNFIDRVFVTMALAKRHTFQVLTKRPGRMRDYILGADGRELKVDVPGLPMDREPFDWPLPNVWCGTSIEDQQRADERIPLLLQTPAAVRFLSVEPLLGPVDLQHFLPAQLWHGLERKLAPPSVDWAILGGESGPGARPCHLDWLRSLVAQCRAAEVACFCKQLGSKPLSQAVSDGGDEPLLPLRLRDKKGGSLEEFPPDLRIRQFPREVPHA